MEFENHEEEEEEEEEDEHEGLTPSYDSLSNSNPTRPVNKIPSPLSMEFPVAQRKPRYRECLKNHAVGMGGHALDGCGEFMPAGEEGTLGALNCAACNCHRNFHRKETESVTSAAEPLNFHQQPLLTHYPHGQFPSYYRTPSGYLHVAAVPSAARAPLALPSSSGGGREEQDLQWNLNSGDGHGTSKKRNRTKFTQEQKEKMGDLAERLGWRIQKQDEEAVEQFCNELGIKRQVLKVWMHNNKHNLGKKETLPSLPSLPS